MEKRENQPDKKPENSFNVKEKVMREIENKKIRMRSPFVFLAERLGMESAVTLVLLFGALLVAFIFYSLKKTGLIKFLSLGIPGVRVFFQALPYHYIILFILTLMLAVYLANKLEMSLGNFQHTNIFVALFLAAAVILGVAFGALGAEEFLKSWAKTKIPKDIAIHGKIQGVSDGVVMITEDEGVLTAVMDGKATMVGDGKLSEAKGKFLRAVGERDRRKENVFHADQILCCDDN